MRKALKTDFVKNKGQSGPLSVDSKTQDKCQLSVKFVSCQLKFWPFVSCQRPREKNLCKLAGCTLNVHPANLHKKFKKTNV